MTSSWSSGLTMRSVELVGRVDAGAALLDAEDAAHNLAELARQRGTRLAQPLRVDDRQGNRFGCQHLARPLRAFGRLD